MPGIIDDGRDMTAYKAIVYYCSISAVGKAVGMVSDEAASIKPWLYDIKEETFVENSDLESFLTLLNPDKTRSEFIKAYAAYYLTAGKSYLLALGDVKKSPLELDVVSPDYIELETSDVDPYVKLYRYNVHGMGGEIKFERSTVKGRFRYYDSGKERELWHVKMFNPKSSRQNEGLSPLDIVHYEVEQHLNSSRHNLSTLLKGARLSGILSIEGELGDEQRERLRAKIDGEWAGADNAGQIPIIDNSKATFSEFSKSMKDMDFLELKKEVTAAIYNIYNIPLPLISPDQMTLNNYKEAKYALYDMAVLPVVSRLYEELSNFLLPRFGIDPSKFKLWYDKKDIPALELRRAEETKRKKESGVYTINELRNIEGLDARPDGDVYANNKPTPVPMQSMPEPVIKDEDIKSKFVSIMSKQMDKQTGLRKYSDQEIEDISKEKGL